jgi:hypothetical protein
VKRPTSAPFKAQRLDMTFENHSDEQLSAVKKGECIGSVMTGKFHARRSAQWPLEPADQCVRQWVAWQC